MFKDYLTKVPFIIEFHADNFFSFRFSQCMLLFFSSLASETFSLQINFKPAVFFCPFQKEKKPREQKFFFREKKIKCIIELVDVNEVGLDANRTYTRVFDYDACEHKSHIMPS